jgi:diguanylate cyclase (GGDEF)-like protein
MSSADRLPARRDRPELIASVNCNPGGEDARIAALHRYGVLDTAPEEAFDTIAKLVKTVLEMPMVTVSLVDRERQWFKSRIGMPDQQTPRDISFCTHTVEDTAPLVVSDARLDPRFATSPLVAGPPFIRFYAGVPLRSRDGYNVGALCAMDTKVRQLNAEQLGLLEGLGRLVVDELELRVRASTDSLTGAMSRSAIFEQARREIARSKRYGKPLSCILIDLDHFKAVNDTYGHGVGDLVLKEIATVCTRWLRACDYFGRIGGEEFVVLLPETAFDGAIEVAERLRADIEVSAVEAGSARIGVTASLGVAANRDPDTDVDALLHAADVAMYAAKNDGRNLVRFSLRGQAPLPCQAGSAARI